MSTAELFSAALALKPKLRGELIKALLDSMENDDALPFENATESELQRRRSSDRPRVAHDAAIAHARGSLRK